MTLMTGVASYCVTPVGKVTQKLNRRIANELWYFSKFPLLHSWYIGVVPGPPLHWLSSVYTGSHHTDGPFYIFP
jgi:hypothetical protein